MPKVTCSIYCILVSS